MFQRMLDSRITAHHRFDSENISVDHARFSYGKDCTLHDCSNINLHNNNINYEVEPHNMTSYFLNI